MRRLSDTDIDAAKSSPMTKYVECPTVSEMTQIEVTHPITEMDATLDVHQDSKAALSVVTSATSLATQQTLSEATSFAMPAVKGARKTLRLNRTSSL